MNEKMENKCDMIERRKKGDTEDYAEIRATFHEKSVENFFQKNKFTKTDARKIQDPHCPITNK